MKKKRKKERKKKKKKKKPKKIKAGCDNLLSDIHVFVHF